MKACRACGRLYPDDAGFCPADGEELTSATQVPVPPDDEDPRVGQLLIDRYEVRRVVADGGMGRVYEALDLQARRNVAIKVLHPEVATDEIAVERFKREFEVSEQLPHEHIVEVYDFQPTHDGSYALVMEFLYGEDLRALLKRTRVVSPGRLVRMLSQLAIGLDYAHERNLVHRDLKPDNIFLCQTAEGDNVKVLDFGSVKDTGSGARKLTVVGTTIGSPFYMAPEQAQGLDTLDHRADVWALAAIAYECVTGTVPFRGSNGPSTLLQILTKEPEPAVSAAAGQKHPVPPSMDRALAKALKKIPSVRTASVGAFADDVGHAYGLDGDYRTWAVMDEQDLQTRIDAKLPSVMGKGPKSSGSDAAADAFFGEENSLGVTNTSWSSTQAPSVSMGSHSISGLPKRRGVGWWLVPIVMVLALITGVALALLMP